MDNKIKSVYFSHPVSHYDTEIENDCINIILYMLLPSTMENNNGIELFNPNQLWLNNLYNNRKKNGDKDAFRIFREIALSCDIIVGTTFMDGSLGAGVADECVTGVKNNKTVFMIRFFEGMKLFVPFTSTVSYNLLSIDETRNRIKNGEL